MKKKNHLDGQTSPYLLQHLYNPVDWYPWGEEALAKAKNENKPLLLSIGYSACHWCHVMEKESFEDTEVAYVMNSHFVCVKVDREERPDLDHLYMNAVQLVSGQGGWPLNCFALPDGRPFWGGTYFRKDQWLSILERVAALYADNHGDVMKQAENLTRGVASASFVGGSGEKKSFSRKDAHVVAENLLSYMDEVDGGTKGAPKFPLPNNLAFLLHYHHLTGNKESFELARLSLEKMAMGGIYDQIGGGFARYATDAKWKIPHFEKMLYDNAQLISVYTQAWKTTNEPMFRDVVYETIAFVERELLSADGMFYAALDADSEGEEGRYYVWTDQQLSDVLGDDAPLVGAFYQLGGEAYWEDGRNILLRKETSESFAKKQGLDVAAWQKLLDRARKKLLNARSKRIKPGLDDKIIVSWNALMIQALADAWSAFNEERFLKLATRAAELILKHAITHEGRVFRTIRKGEVRVSGFLEDYAFLSMALIRLYEVTANQTYIVTAKKLAAYVLTHFQQPGTNLFAFSSKEDEQLASPHFGFYDNVMPSSNSVMARVLFYLANYFEDPLFGNRSSSMLGDMKERLDKYSSSFTNWGILLLHHVYQFYTVVATGGGSEEHLKALNRHYLPQAIMAACESPEAPDADAPGILPVFNNRFTGKRALIYVCAQGHCKLPVDCVDDALFQIRDEVC